MMKHARPSSYRHMPRGVWWLLLLLIAAGPASTKIAGAGWLLFVLFGGWAAWRWPAVVSSSEVDRTLERAALAWLLLCVAAFVVRAIPQFYWGDPWGDRHFEFRVLLSAMATYGLVRRMRLTQQQLLQLALALGVATVVAFVVVNVKERELPSDPIMWASGLAFIVSVLLPLIPRMNHRPWLILALSAGVLLGCVSILLTGSRGVYPALLWPIILALVLAWSRPTARRKLVPGFMAVVFFFVAAGLLQPRLWQFPLERAALALHEATALLQYQKNPDADAIETSVGLRLYMWQRAPEVIAQAPWMGHGKEGRLSAIRSWGQEVHSEVLGSMHHVHQEWLHAMMDHGVLGATSMLLFLLAPLLAAWVLRHRIRMAAAGMLGITFTHVVTGLTNITSLNHYGVMFSLMTGLVLVSALVVTPISNGSSPHPESLQ